jgi:hypothetical protein
LTVQHKVTIKLRGQDVQFSPGIDWPSHAVFVHIERTPCCSVQYATCLEIFYCWPTDSRSKWPVFINHSRGTHSALGSDTLSGWDHVYSNPLKYLPSQSALPFKLTAIKLVFANPFRNVYWQLIRRMLSFTYIVFLTLLRSVYWHLYIAMLPVSKIYCCTVQYGYFFLTSGFKALSSHFFWSFFWISVC